jgi:2-polyprenyl-3-methyl-5-hydroxy-6-metoxy-1,4-benzoquinol methylase
MNMNNTDKEVHSGDKAGEEYWTKVWKETTLPEPIDIHHGNINHHVYRSLHQFFTKLFKGVDTKNKSILEIGCGNSVFLSYFHKEFGLAVAGVDYSEYGIIQTQKVFDRDGVKGNLYLADAFAPPAELVNKYDYVISLGVAEHFEDTTAALHAFSQFVKPGGVLITSVPNLSGVTGFLQAKMNKPVMDIHVPMDKEYLDNAVQKAGLQTIMSKYFVSISFAATLEGLHGERIPYFGIKRAILKTMRYSSKLIWMVERITGSLPERKLLSSGIINAARKPAKN